MSSDTTNDCGCCQDEHAGTPEPLENPPGRSAITYRVGTQARFKQAMLKGLSKHEELSKFTTREDDDPSIALLDAAATMLDSLTFYQERIVNEGFLRTASERRSILELARSIGYELRPGVAAGTHLAFTLETAPGSPLRAPISIGTKVQSLPGPDEKPQVFETIEAFEARPEWNSLKPQTSELQPTILQELYLKGSSNNLKAGDAILIVGRERTDILRTNWLDSDRWDFRRVKEVESDTSKGWTRLLLDRKLGSDKPRGLPAQEDVHVYVMRLRAALFSHNAPDFSTMPERINNNKLGKDWPGQKLSGIAGSKQSIVLDAVYSQITLGSWVVLAVPRLVELYQVKRITESSRTNFSISAKTTVLELTGENLPGFEDEVRATSVFAQSEILELAERPLRHAFPLGPGIQLGPGTLTPVHGDVISLSMLTDGLTRGQAVIVTGKLARVKVQAAISGAAFTVGESLRVLETPKLNGDKVTWFLEDAVGVVNEVSAQPGSLQFEQAHKNDPLVSEVVFLSDLPTVPDKTHTVLTFTRPLVHTFDRETVSIQANVVKATHGETQREVLGSGHAAHPFQRFGLKKHPLTFVSAATPSGGLTTLEVRVDDVRWTEVPSLYTQSAKAQVYTTRLADDGAVTVQFGDGLSGARLPSGTENVTGVYRAGTGLEGQVRAEQLSLLLTRPLGVKSVINPLAPTGAQNPEERDQARQNAPLTVLTLERVVSVRDYENFARAFSGIGKAQAITLGYGTDEKLT
jgi:hypothetical protein